MAIDTVITKRAMLDAFKQMAKPTMFLSQHFKTTERSVFRSKKCVIDVKRNLRSLAVDVVRGTGGRMNNNKRFTTKEYEPPMYDEFMSYNEEELNERMPGMTEYDEPEYVSQFLAILTEDRVELKNEILRAIEWQAANTLITGTLPLINNDTVDFKQKATHNFAASPIWSNASGAPITDLITAIGLNQKDGKISSGEYVAIFGQTAWLNFIERLKGDSEITINKVKLNDIDLPVMNTEGASFHGTVAAGSYVVQLWTYPQSYLVPTGFSLSNEGTEVPYLPVDKVIVIPPSNLIDLRLVYAGIPALVNRQDPRLQAIGIGALPSNIRTDFHPYSALDDEALCVKNGVRSAPMTIPTQIDGWTVIKTEG